MNRKTFIQLPLIFIGVTVLAVVLLAAWLVMLAPVMIRPRIIASFSPADKLAEHMTKRMIQSAMKGGVKHAQSGNRQLHGQVW